MADVSFDAFQRVLTERNEARKDVADYARNLDQFRKQADAALALVREAVQIVGDDMAQLPLSEARGDWYLRARAQLGDANRETE